ncbi:MAG: NHLP bacteriocin export ABC transporter permease/ATPase subunit [Chlorobiaceae bacterium]|nr:NHLP bacteriocin export ABC transporter permease/ATPase subunit [Chlorobiaceae bacterium]
MNKEKAAALAEKRFTEKNRFQTERYRKALEGLSEILVENDNGDAAAVSDPLLAACMLVGLASHIVISEPPSEIDASHEDPLQFICRFSGIRARRVSFSRGGRWWLHENGPLLAFRGKKMNPVALLPGKKGYRLIDPQTHENLEVDELLQEELDHENAWMFYRPFPERVLHFRDIVRYGISGSRSDLAIMLLFGFAGASIGLLVPILTGILFDTIIPRSSSGQLLQLGTILAAGITASCGFELARQILVMRVQSRLDIRLQPAFIDRLLNLPSTFFRNYSSGDLATRILGISQIREVLSSAVLTALLGLVFGFMNFFLLFFYSWKLAFVAAAMTMVLVGITVWASYRQLGLKKAAFETRGNISGLLGNLLTGIAKIRLTGTEKHAFAEWASRFRKERSILLKAGSMQNMLAVTSASFPVIGLAIIIFSAGSTLTGEHLSCGSFIAFTTAFTTFQSALLQSAMTIIGSLDVVPLYERIKPVLDALPETSFTRSHPGKLQGEVEMQGVNFSYTPDGPQILNDIDFKAEPGEFIAIVGSSGSGKSTIMRLLLGFEKPAAGTVFYDGVDLATLNVQAVRRQIGVVLQNAHLQPGFIINTILGSSTLTAEDAWEAAKMAGIDEDIRKMPMGMYTIISEGCETISGGQKQRLLIAGALVRKPGMIFFDEATSALDNETQEIISRSLETLQSTRIVIAHRLSTIRNADRIYCIEGGRVVQTGRYDELMAVEGFFRELANRQIA